MIRPHETPLLSHGTEDEIGVGIRQVAELLLPLSEADTEHSARADPDQRLIDLAGAVGAVEELVGVGRPDTAPPG